MVSSVRRSFTFIVFACVVSLVLLAIAATAAAQSLPRSFAASPDIYKVIAQNEPKAGAAVVQQPTAGHVLENIGAADCKLIMFEPA